MGFLHYDGRSFPMEDRLLAHLQVIIGMKLRRGENFFLTWLNTPAVGSGRNSVWVDNGIPIFCEYEGSRIPVINREWVETLAHSAGTNFGLQISTEGRLEPIAIPFHEEQSATHDGPDDPRH